MITKEQLQAEIDDVERVMDAEATLHGTCARNSAEHLQMRLRDYGIDLQEDDVYPFVESVLSGDTEVK